MQEKKINLEEILTDIFPERESGYAYEDLHDVSKAYIKKSMLEFGEKLLELAAENAKAENSGATTDSSGRIISGKTYVIKETISNTIKQVE